MDANSKNKDCFDYTEIAKNQLRDAYKSLLKAAEIGGEIEYKDHTKGLMLGYAIEVIKIAEKLR